MASNNKETPKKVVAPKKKSGFYQIIDKLEKTVNGKKPDQKELARQTLRLNRKRILTADSPYAVREAYVSLRTKLLLSIASDGTDNCKTFVITSPNPSEGKSITILNTAISFAMLDKKVLLIDCDMRRPNISRLLDISSKNGLSNLLTGINECHIHSFEDLPISFITAGEIPPNPSELLSSEAFKNVISKLKKDYDYIFFDAPPINVVADAQIIAPLVDGAILLVRSDATLYTDAKQAEEALTAAGAKICGIVLNDVNLKSSKYSYNKYKYKYKYKYRYGSKYGYKYGYHSHYSRDYAYEHKYTLEEEEK